MKGLHLWISAWGNRAGALPSWLMLAAALAALSGCAIPLRGEDGTFHYLVIGIGVVSTPPREGKADVLATKAEALGVMVSNQPGVKFTLGYAKSSLILVPETRDNVSVEVSQRTFGPYSVQVNPACQEGGKYEPQREE